MSFSTGTKGGSQQGTTRKEKTSTAAAEYFSRVVIKLELNPYSCFLYNL